MATTTIRVDETVRARIAKRAKTHGKSMSQVVDEALEAQDEQEFWAEYRRTMLTEDAKKDSQQRAKLLDGTAKDGLEAEDWGHLQ